MDFHILGSLEVVDEGRVVTVSGSRQQALLALLLLHPNETLGTDRLIEELWGQRPPATAANTLQVHVSRLRKALADGNGSGAALVTRDHGYQLELDPERLDAHRFERLVVEGRAELAARRPDRAAATLERALSLWRGPALGALAYEPFAEREAARLGELRIGALEELIDAKLALGRDAEVIAEVDALIAEHPYRERLRAQKMLALYRSDRQADALQVYQDTRSRLVEDLGIEPGERLRRLEQAVLAQDPALLLTPARTPLPPELEADAPLAGREEEMRRLRQQWRRARSGAGRLVVLTGEHGIGKTRLAAGSLVERARETARIAGRLGEAAAGTGGLTVIEGPAGIGKTSLLQEVRAQAEQRGMRVLAGRGSELERDYAFGVLRQALERPVAELGDGERDMVLAGHAAHAAPLFDPSLAAVSTEVLLHGVQWLLANLAERQPLVLAIDDAHWADETSIVALGYLARRLRDVPIAIVVATRPPPVDGCAALAALVADVTAERLRPAPLSDDAVAKASGSDDPAFVRAIARATGGNPFLLHELLRELGRERSAVAVAAIEPRDLGRQMLARLGDAARAFAWALAILGDRASVGECATLADIDAPEQVVEELIAAGVLADDARLQFRHPLIAAAVDAGLSPARRASWHVRAGALLRDAGADVERVAVHVAAGAPAGSAQVVDLLTEAAARATARAAPTSAVPLLRRALAEPPDPARRVDVLLALAAALNAVGDGESPAVYAEAGATSNDPEVKTRALEARAWWWGIVPEGVPEDLAEVDALIASLTDERDDLRARLEALRLSVAGRSRPAMAAAIERAEALGVPTAAGAHPDTLASIAFWRLQHGASASDCIGLARRAIAAAPRERFAIPSIWFPFAVGILQRGECLAEAADVARDMRDAARENGSPTWYALAAHLVARYVADAGDLNEAEAEITAAVDATAAANSGWMSAVPTGTLAYILVRRGRAADAERTLRRAGLHDALPDTRPVDQLLPIRALVRHAQGRHDAAHADLIEVLRRYAVRGPMSINEHAPRILLARVEHALGAKDAATTVADGALQSAERWGTPGAIGEALHTNGLIASDPDALRAAIASLARSPLRVSHAAALLDLGALLRRQGARRDAREPLLAALELARDCGADGLAARAAEELEATGATIPARAASGSDALTPSERRIARLAADGATNKEIAQELFLSVKTIEMHLDNAYRQLNIGSRRDLGAALETTSPLLRAGRRERSRDPR